VTGGQIGQLPSLRVGATGIPRDSVRISRGLPGPPGRPAGQPAATGYPDRVSRDPGARAEAGGDLDAAWERALELAWESFRAGTTPVGAVVVDPSGVIIAQGRGRRFEAAGPPGQLAGSDIAHAEVNALAGLRAGAGYRDHVLLTTLEPCGMCHGAALQAGVGALRFAGADPYAGTGALDFGTPQARRRGLAVHGPLAGERGRLAELLHIVWLVSMPARPHVIAAQRAGLPDLTRLAEQAETRELVSQAAARGLTLAGLRAILSATMAARPDPRFRAE
jgi:tRNA(adenine34) deaminase